MSLYDSTGRHHATARGDVDLFLDAYTGEFVEFTDAVREGRAPSVTGRMPVAPSASPWRASSRSRPTHP